MSGSNFVTCPNCANVLELVEGKVDLKVKDDQGKTLSKDAAIHMSKHRVRCNSCGNNFCAKCKAEPYHISKTCEEHEKFKKSRKCRYCFELINSPPVSQLPAFKDVCNKKDCIQLMKQSCTKIHPCGHYCCGYANEVKCLPCLHEDCVAKNPKPTNDNNADSYCIICYT